MDTIESLKHSANGIDYYVTQNNVSERAYGIAAIMHNDKSDRASAENLFFTEAEANSVCKWLAENEVYPVTLQEVLENCYIF